MRVAKWHGSGWVLGGERWRKARADGGEVERRRVASGDGGGLRRVEARTRAKLLLQDGSIRVWRLKEPSIKDAMRLAPPPPATCLYGLAGYKVRHACLHPHPQPQPRRCARHDCCAIASYHMSTLPRGVRAQGASCVGRGAWMAGAGTERGE